MTRCLRFLVLLSLPHVLLAKLNGTGFPRFQRLAEDCVLRWKISGDAISLQLEANATGWVAFGISEAGGMKGADMVYFEAASGTLVDAHSFDYQKPEVDICQDWTLISGAKENGRIRIEISRALETGDEQDRKLVNDENTMLGHYFVAAWGDHRELSYHAKSKAKGRIFLFGDEPVDKRSQMMRTPGIKSADLLRTTFDEVLPAKTNHYDVWCINLADAMGVDGKTPVHIVGHEPNLWPETEAFVHHFLVFSYTEENCQGETGGICMNWGPGMFLTPMPAKAGIRLFGDGGYRSLKFQTHFNNPRSLSGLRDRSGLRIHYTPQLREHDVGVLQIGDPFVRLLGRALPSGWSRQSFGCHGLTRDFDQPEVFVFLQYLHMHGAGERIEQRVVRGGSVARADSVDVYEFAQNGGVDPLSTDAGYWLRRGDDFELDCVYHVTGSRHPAWGLGSEDEMCLTYLSYYPKQPRLTHAGACKLPMVEGTPGYSGVYLGQTKYHGIAPSRRFGTACDGSNVQFLPMQMVQCVLLGVVMAALALTVARRMGSAEADDDDDEQLEMASGEPDACWSSASLGRSACGISSGRQSGSAQCAYRPLSATDPVDEFHDGTNKES